MPKSVVKEKGVLRLNGVTSKGILELLKQKHAMDVIIPECKNGETWGARDLLKLDAWVLKRTYSPLTTIGYEIKCSRRDFEQDQKWMGYLDLCHQFYFVCPSGLIRATDLPQRVGIIWVSNSQKLHTKRKAESVEPDAEKMNGLLIYALMSRARIVANMLEANIPEPPDRLQVIKDVIDSARERKELAAFITGHVREVYEQARSRDVDAGNKVYAVKKFEERLARLGIRWDSDNHEWQDSMRVESEINALRESIDDGTLMEMRRVGGQLTKLTERIDRIRRGEK